MLSCDACRVAKKKCSRKRPCERCGEKGLECTYNATNYHNEVVPKYRQYEDRLCKLEGLISQIRRHKVLPSSSPELIYFNNPSEEFFGFSYQVQSKSPIRIAEQTKSYLENLLDVFLTSLLPPYPFINPVTLRAKFEINPFNSPLLTAAYCRAQIYLSELSSTCCIPEVRDNYFYKLTLLLLQKNTEEISLELVQALLLTSLIELESNLSFAFRRHCTEAIRKSNVLYLDSPNSFQRIGDLEILKLEKDATWCMAFLLDYLSSCIWGLPPILGNLPTSMTNIDFETIHCFQSIQTPSSESDALSEQFKSMNLYVSWVKIFSIVNSHKAPLQPFNVFFPEQFRKRYIATAELLTSIQNILPPMLSPSYFNNQQSSHPARTVHLAVYLLHHSVIIDLVELLINSSKIVHMQVYPDLMDGCQELHFVRIHSAKLVNEILEPYALQITPQQPSVDLNFVFTIAYYHIYKAFIMDLISPNSHLFANRAKEQFLKIMKFYPSLNRILVNLDILETEPKILSSNGGFQYIGICTSPICPFTASRQIRP